ncbi:hypothetical protein C0989_009485 [Termitomyces sp. Mn162]|nr:hypothetical protein C0989_009485 [Termitomyces sp. Mn162]
MADMLWMLLEQVQVDQYVIQVHNDKNVIHVMMDVVYEVSKGGGGVNHSKGHHEVLKEAIVGVKGTRVEIYLCVNLGTAEVVNKVSNQGEGILVLFGDFVESLIIYTELE